MSTAFVKFSHINSIRSDNLNSLTNGLRIGGSVSDVDQVSDQISISHVSLRVKSLQKSLDFYVKGLGMKEVEVSDDKKVIVGYENASSSSLRIELVGIEDKKILENFKLGDSFIGIGIRSQDIDVLANNALICGGEVLIPIDEYAYAASLIPDEDEMKSTPVVYGKVSDPDGYIVELQKTTSSATSSCSSIQKFVLNVIDLDESIEWYSSKLGLNLLRKRSNVLSTPREASFCSYMGYKDELSGPYLELLYKYSTDKIESGDGFSHLVFHSAANELGTGEATTVLVDPSTHKVILQPRNRL